MQQHTLPNIDTTIDCRYIEPGTMLDIAKAIAIRAHEHQKRRDGTPYSDHPITVASLLEDPKDKVVAFLHDVIEDTKWTYDDIRAALSKAEDIQSYDLSAIMYSLYVLTHNKNEAYNVYITKVLTDITAIRVKLADIIHNMSCEPSPKQKAKYLAAAPLLLKAI